MCLDLDGGNPVTQRHYRDFLDRFVNLYRVQNFIDIVSGDSRARTPHHLRGRTEYLNPCFRELPRDFTDPRSVWEVNVESSLCHIVCSLSRGKMDSSSCPNLSQYGFVK